MTRFSRFHVCRKSGYLQWQYLKNSFVKFHFDWEFSTSIIKIFLLKQNQDVRKEPWISMALGEINVLALWWNQHVGFTIICVRKYFFRRLCLKPFWCSYTVTCLSNSLGLIFKLLILFNFIYWCCVVLYTHTGICTGNISRFVY